MLQFVVPKFVGSLSGTGVPLGSLSVNDVRQLQKRLKEIEPSLRTKLMRDAKKAGEPTAKAIKARLQTVKPLRGMLRGRLNWENSVDSKGRSYRPDDVKVQFRTSMSGRSLTTSLVRVRAASPAVSMADMAGRTGRYVDAGYRGSGETRSYQWRGTERTHRVNGQGRAMMNRLGGKASRYVWPAAERSIVDARQEVDRILREAYATIGKKLF